MQEQDRLVRGVAFLDIMESHGLIIARGVDEVVRELNAVQRLDGAFRVGLAGCRIAEVFLALVDHLLVGEEVLEHLLRPFQGARSILAC